MNKKKLINVNYPFNITVEEKYEYLLEKGFTNTFTIKQKLYYDFFRPFIPINIRQKLQEKINSNKDWKKDFIWDDLVKKVKHKNNTGLNIDDPLKKLELGYIYWNEFTYKNNATSAIVLTHDVETEDGFKFIPKIIEIEQQYGFKSSWNIVPYKYKIDEGIIRLIKEAGHEIGIHGYNHDGKLYYSDKVFNERARYINKALKKYGAIGFRSPMVHRNLNFLQKLNIKYDASCFDYDPFQPFPGGTGSIWPFIAGKFVELPYTLPQDHTLFYLFKVNNISIWKRKIKWLQRNKGVILTLTHPDYLIKQKHLKMYVNLLEFLNTIENAWITLPSGMASYWMNEII